MKWSIIGIDYKGIWVGWGWSDSWGDADNGESYDLNMPRDWWQTSFKNARDNWDYHRGSFPIIVPSFIVYIVKPISSIKLIIGDIKLHFEEKENEEKLMQMVDELEKVK